MWKGQLGWSCHFYGSIETHKQFTDIKYQAPSAHTKAGVLWALLAGYIKWRQEVRKHQATEGPFNN